MRKADPAFLISGTFFRVNGQCQHKGAKSVLRPVYLDHVGVCPVKDFFGNNSHRSSGRVHNGVIPFQKVSLHLPAIAVDVVPGFEESQFFADTAYVLIAQIQFELRQKGQYFFPDSADLISRGIKDLQAVSLGKLPLYGIDRIFLFIVDVIAVKP